LVWFALAAAGGGWSGLRLLLALHWFTARRVLALLDFSGCGGFWGSSRGFDESSRCGSKVLVGVRFRYHSRAPARQLLSVVRLAWCTGPSFLNFWGFSVYALAFMVGGLRVYSILVRLCTI